MITEPYLIMATAELAIPAQIGWVYFPTALLLGALHGLEPGHSKTMMAAFIIAVKGTVRQAILLGLAATFSHTLVIWVLAAITLAFKEQLKAENVEPWMQMASGIIVIALAAWMAVRIRRENVTREAVADRQHEHDHDHGHGHHHHHGHAHGDRLGDLEADDAHAREHAAEIQQRFADRQVTTGQIVMFGLTGGLLPCPGALTVALLCLQTDRAALGFALVLAFSLGLAITLVTVGAAAAWSARRAAARFKWLDRAVSQLPYLSTAVLVVIGFFLFWHGYQNLAATTH